MKILIADDEFSSRMKLQKHLSHYGHSYTVINGEEAVEAFMLAHKEGEPFHLICLDIMMPEKDGIEVLKFIRKKEQEMGIKPGYEAIIMMITAEDSAKTAIDSFMQYGCDDYIVKPIKKDELISKLKENTAERAKDHISEI